MRGSGVFVLVLACSGGLGTAFGMMAQRATAPTVESLLVRGRAELNQGRAEVALALWMREAPRLVDATEVWFEAGMLARRLGRHAEAATAFERVPRESPCGGTRLANWAWPGCRSVSWTSPSGCCAKRHACET